MLRKLNIFVRFEQCLVFNFYLDGVWIFVVSFLLYIKVDKLERRTKYLAIAVYCVMLIIESLRLVLGHFAANFRKIPELSGFLMVSVLMQLPLVSFFLFNPNLHSYPVEITLHTFMMIFTLAEIILCTLALKQVSAMAKYMYFNQSQRRRREKIEQQ